MILFEILFLVNKLISNGGIRVNNKSSSWLMGGLLIAMLNGCSDNSPVQTTPEAVSEQPKVVADTPEKIKAYSAEAFFKTVSVFGSSINHDATSVLVSSDESGVFNTYQYALDGSGIKRLTDTKVDTIFGVSWFPQDDRILYTADQGGDELNHFYVREIDGKTKDLTPGNKLKARFISWSDKHDFFYVATNERDPKGFDVYRYSVDDYQRELIFQNDDNRGIGVISPNGRWLTLNHSVSNADANIYLVDLNADDKQAHLITPHDGAINHQSYTFTPDSEKLIYATNEHGEFNQAWSLNVTSGKKSLFYQADWDVSNVYFSPDGQYRVVGVNRDAQTRLDIAQVATGKNIQLPELPAGDLRGVRFSSDSSKMVFYINSDTSPSNLFSYQLGDNKVRRLTDTLNPEIDESKLVTSQVKRFLSFDGLEVPGILYKPKNANQQNKVPALIWVHGGPGGQSRKGYNAAIQHLVNHGYAIFAVNNRGSSGYGKTFYHLDDKKHGEDDLQDIVYGKKYLQTLNWVNDERIGIMGGSYGGYMTMAGLAFTDEFKVGIDIFGVTNWERTLKNIPPWWESFKKYLYDEMGDPATDADRHKAISPLFHAEKIKAPVLIVQGANDPRVLQVESDEMVAAIRKNNVPVEYVLFEDEGHGFRKKVNRITASNAYLDFLNKHL